MNLSAGRGGKSVRDTPELPSPEPSREPWADEVRKLAKTFVEQYAENALLAACIVIVELEKHASHGMTRGRIIRG